MPLVAFRLNPLVDVVEGERGGDGMMWTGKHYRPCVLIQCTIMFIAEKAVF